MIQLGASATHCTWCVAKSFNIFSARETPGMVASSIKVKLQKTLQPQGAETFRGED